MKFLTISLNFSFRFISSGFSSGFTDTFFICSFLIPGCAKNLKIILRSGEELNNGGNPVVVRMYLLKSDINFQKATIETFWKNDREALGADLVEDPIEVLLHPRETKRLKKIKLVDEVGFLGAVADFYQPDLTQWKFLYDFTKQKKNEVIIAVGRNKLLIVERED